MVVAARLQRAADIGLSTKARMGNDKWLVRVKLSQALGDFVAVHPRHGEVEDHYIGMEVVGRLQGHMSIGSGTRFVSPRLQEQAKGRDRIRHVINCKNAQHRWYAKYGRGRVGGANAKNRAHLTLCLLALITSRMLKRVDVMVTCGAHAV